MGGPGLCPTMCRLDLCSGIVRRATNVRPKGFPNRLRGTGITMGGAICRKGRLLVGILPGEALVTPRKSTLTPVPISVYMPAGLPQPFPSNYFRVKEIPSGEVKIVRGRTSVGQNVFLHDHCMTLPITQYRILRRDGTRAPFRRTNNPRDCISMRLIASKLIFEVTWNNTDDIDLVLTEPDGPNGEAGDVISRFNLKSSTGGRLNGDSAIGDSCEPVFPGETFRESVFYDIDPRVKSGVYKMRIQHFKNCGNGPTNLDVRAVIDGPNGVVHRKLTSVSNRDRGAIAAEYDFNITPGFRLV